MRAEETAPRSSRFGKAARCVLQVILALLLLLNILVLVMQNEQGLDAISRLPFAMIEITGGSMEPELHDGEVVFAVQTPYEKLKPGDTVIFGRNSELIIHKIVAQSDDMFITRGTANEADDAPITAQEYRARMLCRIPGLNALWKVCDSPLRFVIFAVLAALLIFGRNIFPALYRVLFEKKH